MEQVLEQLKTRFGGTDAEHTRADEWFVTCPQERTVPALGYLKEHAGFTHLSLLTAVDWIEENRFQLTYMLYNPERRVQLGLRTFIPRSVWPEESVMESAHRLWPAIKTYQRELHEMFGIDFPESPEVNDPLILEYWDTIPPNRRDFDTKKYSEETYFPRPGRGTSDPATVMREQLYPREGEKDA